MKRNHALPLVAALACGLLIMTSAWRPVAAEPIGKHRLGKIIQLTFEGDNGEAYFSSDGTKLIYQSSGGDYKCDKIWTMRLDGSEKKMVSPTRGAHTCSFFFPGDQEIVFASTSRFDQKCPPKFEKPAGVRYVWPLYPYNIYVAKADGSNARAITDNPKYDAEPIISPDGSRIVFGSQREGDFDIYIMNSDGSDVRRLTSRVGYDGGPWFSPDGKKIVWRAWYPKTAEERAQWRDSMEKSYIRAVPLDIWVMKADGSDKRRLTDNGAVNWSPSWHPDNRRIVFSSNKDDWREEHGAFGYNFELYIFNEDGTGLERLTDNDVFDSFPMFSPDGKKLVFASNRNPKRPRETDIYLADWQD